MSTRGNAPDIYVLTYPGDPTNALVSSFNPPLGALVIDSLTGDWYRKTSGYNDNSGYIRTTIAESLDIPAFASFSLVGSNWESTVPIKAPSYIAGSTAGVTQNVELDGIGIFHFVGGIFTQFESL